MYKRRLGIIVIAAVIVALLAVVVPVLASNPTAIFTAENNTEDTILLNPEPNGEDTGFSIVPVPVPHPLAFDCFLKIDAIPGESTDPQHQGWIDVMYFDGKFLTEGNGNGNAPAGGMQQGRVQIDFSIIKPLDKSTPKLAEACLQRTKLGTVVLDLVRNGVVVLRYTLSGVEIQGLTYSRVWSDIGLVETSSLDVVPMDEELSFSFTKIQCQYMSPLPTN